MTEKPHKSRRTFLKGIFSSLGAAVALRVGSIFPEGRYIRNRQDNQTLQQTDEGELYAGFVLLPAVDSPRPDYVECAPAPILHGNAQVDPAALGEEVKLANVEALTNFIPFATYKPTRLPSGYRLLSTDVLQFAGSKEIFTATLNFGEKPDSQALIRMQARPVYPKPYPIRPVHHPVKHENEIVQPERVDFTPSPGVMRPNASGHKIQWIEQDILYSLIANHDASREAAKSLARSLIQIG